MAAFEETNRLQRKMDNLCVIIEKLLDASPPPMAILKEHITALEELIAELPEEESWTKLVDKYRDAVVRIWQRYELGSQLVIKATGEQSSELGSMSFADSTESIAGHTYAPSLGGGSDWFAANAAKYRLSLPIKPSAEQVRSVLRNAFDQLDCIDSVEGHIGATKALLMLVTKAHTFTMSYWKNNALLENIVIQLLRQILTVK